MTTNQIVDNLNAQLAALGLGLLDDEQVQCLTDGPMDERTALLDDLDVRVGVRPCTLDDTPAADLLTAAFGPPSGLNADCSYRIWHTGQNGFVIADTENGYFAIWKRVEGEDSPQWLDVGSPVPAWDIAWLVAYWAPVLISE